MKKIIAIALVLAFVLSFAACSDKPLVNAGISETESNNPFDKAGLGAAGAVEVTASKDAYNRITGKNDMASDRVGYRPIAVSVNNVSLSWPQYGISKADAIIEMETEGGITRLMCLFADSREVEQLGSVRSLRNQFLEVVFPLDAIIVHIGTSTFANKFIAQYSYRTVDGDAVDESGWQDQERIKSYSADHCWFVSGSSIQAGIDASGVTTETANDISLFNFVDEGAEKVTLTGGAANNVTFMIDPSFDIYDGDFRYDAASGQYLKWQRGKQHVDAGNGNKQLAFDNVFVLCADIQDRTDGSGLVTTDYAKGGTGYYFTNGTYEAVNWTKPDVPSNFSITSAATGEEISVNTGVSYISIIRNSLADTIKIA